MSIGKALSYVYTSRAQMCKLGTVYSQMARSIGDKEFLERPIVITSGGYSFKDATLHTNYQEKPHTGPFLEVGPLNTEVRALLPAETDKIFAELF